MSDASVNAQRTAVRTGVLPPGRRRLLHSVAFGTWLTGAVWLVFHYFVRVIDDFGFDNPHPQQQWWLIAHAVFSFAAVWLFGSLWSDHVVRGWKAGVRKPTGGTLFGVLVWLTISGCALYYLGSDAWRSWTSLAHWIPGLAAIVVFVVHFRNKRRD